MLRIDSFELSSSNKLTADATHESSTMLLHQLRPSSRSDVNSSASELHLAHRKFDAVWFQPNPGPGLDKKPAAAGVLLSGGVVGPLGPCSAEILHS